MEKASDQNKYYEGRVKKLGFDPEKHYAYYRANPDEPIGGKIKQPLIWPDDNGNICIGFLDLDGQMITYDAAPAKSKVDIQPVHWKRFANPKGDARYGPCKKGIGVFPWISPELAQARSSGKKIKRIVITEGAFKGLKAYIDGLGHIIGLPSINIWKPKEDHQIFYQIREIIKDCQVEEILFLTDGDTLTVRWEAGKDLYKRPNSFYVAVRLFKELCREINVTLYYGHINADQPKGLDDLLIEKPEEKEQLRKELFHIPEEYRLCTIMDITAWSFYKIRSYFGIDKPEDFYAMYEQYIGLEEFVFKQGLYKYNDADGKIEYIRMGESVRFERIGKTFFIQGTKPTKREALENVLVPITVDEIKHMYSKKSKGEMETIIRDINYYNGAINRPSHHDYQKFLETFDEHGNSLRWFNVYRKITHQVFEGDITHSLNFIKHIFGEEDIEWKGKKFKSYELGLDYIKILWEQPWQMLPILCLVSQERHTGKTTFWNWMRAIFQQNARFVRVEHLTGQFTSYFANSLLAIVDETLIDKRATMERVKALVTADTFTMEAKHQNAEEVDNYVKVGIASNNINNFAQIDQDEVRFWVRNINTIDESEQNINLLEDLNKEISAFLYFLENRPFVTSKVTRSWFANELIETEALARVKSRSRSGKELLVESSIVDHMKTVKKPLLRFSAKDLKDLIGKDEINGNDIRWVLEDRWGMEKSKSAKNYSLYWLDESYPGDEWAIVQKKKRSICYSFFACDYMKMEDVFAEFDVEDLLEMEAEMLEMGKSSFYTKDSVMTGTVLVNPKYKRIYDEAEQETQRNMVAMRHRMNTLAEWDEMMDKYDTLI